MTVTDKDTVERAKRGIKPDCIGWQQIADALGLRSAKTARDWERRYGMPIINWGPNQVAAYADRLRVWAATQPRAA